MWERGGGDDNKQRRMEKRGGGGQISLFLFIIRGCQNFQQVAAGGKRSGDEGGAEKKETFLRAQSKLPPSLLPRPTNSGFAVEISFVSDATRCEGRKGEGEEEENNNFLDELRRVRTSPFFSTPSLFFPSFFLSSFLPSFLPLAPFF